MATLHLEILITTRPLESRANNWNGPAGATLDFWGVVRALEDGREISGIQYEAHEAMAQHQMKLIADASAEKFELEEVILQHRIGFVAAGEASLFLRVSSGHRGAAYDASAWIVNELKKKVPIWKRPLFLGQEAQKVAAG
jgi:molybdopterin synthase catalytic subunit